MVDHGRLVQSIVIRTKKITRLDWEHRVTETEILNLLKQSLSRQNMSAGREGTRI